jgi:serine protease
VRRKVNALWLLEALALCGLSGAARAQLAPDATPLQSLPGYRNGSAWVSVMERTRDASGVQVVLSSGSHVFHAGIDPHAIVQLAPGRDLQSWSTQARVQVVKVLSERFDMYLVAGANGEDGLDLAARLSLDPALLSAIPDLSLRRRTDSFPIPPDDPHYGGQWYLQRIEIEDAWRLATGDRNTIVVVIDGGCDLQHPDLVAAFAGGRDFVDDDDDPSYAAGKNNAHGTECSGLIAATANNGIGIAGVCPDCSLRCVRLLSNDSTAVPISADLQAFQYAFDVGAAVVSNSWGFAEAMPAPAPLRTLLEQLYDQGRAGAGTLVVFSSGNEDRVLGNDELDAVRGVVSVGAINNFDEATSFSNRGDCLDLTAPTGTLTTDISGPDGDSSDDYTSLFGGTSSACPIVAGVAALVMSARPDMSASDVADLLFSTARIAPFSQPDASGHDETYGFGVVAPAPALRSALGVSEPADAGTDAGGKPAADGGKPRSSSGCSVTGGLGSGASRENSHFGRGSRLAANSALSFGLNLSWFVALTLGFSARRAGRRRARAGG